MSFRAGRIALISVCGVVSGCSDPAAPAPANARVVVTPELVASFSSLGGLHTVTAQVTDTLGAAISDPVTWDVVPASSAVSVDQGLVTVASSASPGEYRVRATVLGVSDTTIVRVLPRPPGKLVFTATIAPNVNQVFIKDFAIDGDAVQVTNGASASGGLGVDQRTGTIIASLGSLPNVDLFRVEGNGIVNLTNNAANSNQGPAFHPITGDIYFSRRGSTGTASQIFRMSPDGSGQVEVSSGSQTKVQPAVSPDGSMLSWTELFPGFNNEIVTASITGANATRFTDRAGSDGSPHWVSNSRIAWGGATTTAPDVFIADAPGGLNPVNLTNRDGASLQPGAGCTPGTITILRRIGTETAAYEFDLTTGLAVKYHLPVARTIAVARRLC